MQKLMRRLTVAAVLGVAAGVGVPVNKSLALDPPAAPQAAKEYYYEVVGGSAKEPNRIRPWSEPFDTEAAAEVRLKSILRDHAKGGLLEFDADGPRGLKVIKTPKTANPLKAVDDVAKKAKQVLTDAERKVGDTLKEYTNRITAAYENATKAKAGMTALTGKIARQQFEDVNKQIDGFNGLRTEASQKVGVAGESLMVRYPTMSRVTPQDLKGKLEDSPPATQTASLAGKRGSGKFGQSAIDVEFQAGGKVIFRDPESNNAVLSEGTWSQTGDHVVMTTKRFGYNGKVTKAGAEGQRTVDKGGNEPWSIRFSNILGKYRFIGDGVSETFEFMPNGILISTVTDRYETTNATYRWIHNNDGSYSVNYGYGSDEPLVIGDGHVAFKYQSDNVYKRVR